MGTQTLDVTSGDGIPTLKARSRMGVDSKEPHVKEGEYRCGDDEAIDDPRRERTAEARTAGSLGLGDDLSSLRSGCRARWSDSGRMSRVNA